MALTQISTNGIKDLNVNTDDIANNAVTMAKLDNTGGIVLPSNIGVNAANMYPNAIVTATLANNAVNADKIINGAINTAKLADQSVTLDKFVHGTSSNNGKFLRANNGADPTFETVNTDLVSDTSPQLGGTLQTNGNNIDFADTEKARFGNGADLQISHDGTDDVIHSTGTSLRTKSNIFRANNANNTAVMFRAFSSGAFEAYHDGSKKLETTSGGATVTGAVTATQFTYASHPGHTAFTGNNSTTTITILSGHNVNSVLVVYNGVVLTPTTDYTINGTTLTLQFTPPTNAQVIVRYLPN